MRTKCGQHGKAMRHASLLLPILARRPGELEQSPSLGFCLTIALSLASLNSSYPLSRFQDGLIPSTVDALEASSLEVQIPVVELPFRAPTCAAAKAGVRTTDLGGA